MVYPDLHGYSIIFSKKAESFLEDLDIKKKKRILKKIRELQTNSKSLDIKKLKSRYSLYRLRVGDFRVIYSIKNERVMIYIIIIGWRKDIYKHSSLA